MKSKIFTLDSRDLINGLIIAFLTAIIIGILEILQNGAVHLGNFEARFDGRNQCSFGLSTQKLFNEFTQSATDKRTGINNNKPLPFT